MSSDPTDPTTQSTMSTTVDTTTVTSPNSKGKGKAVTKADPMHEEEEDDDDDEEEEEEEEEEEDEEVEDPLDEIDPSSIVDGGRRTRGIKVDYTSKEALEKAGLNEHEEEEEDEDVVMS